MADDKQKPQPKPEPKPLNIPKPTPRAPCGHESPCLTCTKLATPHQDEAPGRKESGASPCRASDNRHAATVRRGAGAHQGRVKNLGIDAL
jgi:hypothetical protein